MRPVTALVLVLALSGCARDRSLPAGPLTAPSIRFEHAVYLPPQTPLSAVEPLLRRHANARLVDDARNDYPPPSPGLLEHAAHGLTAADREALQHATRAVVLTFDHPQKDAWPALRLAGEAAAGVARATGGFIYDAETREVFTLPEWEGRRVATWSAPIPEVTDHITIHFYQQGEYVRAVTLGMAKFGLPDVVMDDLTWSLQRSAGNTINLLAQALVEGARLGPGGTLDLDIGQLRRTELREANLATIAPSGTGKARLVLVAGERDDGDPDNRLVAIAFDAYPGNDLHSKREAMLTALFGSTDETTTVEHDAEVLAASRRARAHLPELRAAFNAGLAPAEVILVKAPFATGDGNTEWMWVEVTRWDGASIRGTLRNEPSAVPELRAGQVVEVDEADVFDYIRRKPDGSQEGNTTAAFLSR